VNTMSHGLWRLVMVVVFLTSVGCSQAKRDSVSLMNAGVKSFEKKDFPTAYRHFKSSIEIYDDNPGAYYHLGQIDLYQHKNLGKAREHLETARELATKDKGLLKNILLHLGRLSLKEKKFDEAIKHCDAAIELDPNFATAWYFKGDSYYGKDRFDEADAAWREAVLIQPTEPRAFSALGQMYVRFERFSEAKGVYNEGLKHLPGNIELREGLGVMQLKDNQIKDAVESFRAVLRVAPMRSTSLYNLAAAYIRSGQPVEAYDWLGRYIEVVGASGGGPDLDAARALYELLEAEI
jgi:tetratricopeptide (TPR) repeat protein